MYTIKNNKHTKKISQSSKNKGAVLFNVCFLSSCYCPVFLLKGRSFTRAYGKIQSFPTSIRQIKFNSEKDSLF